VALLRLSNGQVYTAIEDINRIVAPLSIGKFNVSDDVLARVKGFAHPLSHADAMYILDNFDADTVKALEAEGFAYRRVGNVVPSPSGDGSFQFVQRAEGGDPDAPPAARSPKEIADYLIPHYVQVNDWHFVFSGAIIKGVQLEGDLQGVVYCQAGEWIRLNPTILNWPIFPYGEPTAAVSAFDRPFDTPFEMDLHPETEVRPDMLY